MTKEEKIALLNEYLAKYNLNGTNFGKEIGYNATTVSLYKKGKVEIPQVIVWGLQKALNVIRLQEKILS